MPIIPRSGRCTSRTQPSGSPHLGATRMEVPGHDLDALKAALARPVANVRAIVAHTVKGYGCPTLTNDVFAWHRRSPKPDELEQLLAELEQP